ncbi:TPA: hypothetical protein HA372_02130 [Candidatus Woesearchaeota archaeon]|nr:hypothetical protein [Candidatus Woesearchaeota archaeon]HII65398.1 hypothetical protein [Candidatus Woesearchaeota archaeon]HIJ18466.1 hypothetical protein [Candidatus Woesearchaeota archaeon]
MGENVVEYKDEYGEVILNAGDGRSTNLEEEGVYSDEGQEVLLEDDELTSSEQGFMKGFCM